MSAFLIFDIKVEDAEAFGEYAAEIPIFVKKHSGIYRALGGNVDALEGDWRPHRVVVIEFPSPELAKQFLHDPDTQPLIAIRHSSAVSNIILVEGCAAAL
ncbi:MAG TPA: DUF1330 domain-containing protein [Cellvibrionaceae bacterium]|nr:DUF1330 domain-containing protein [Cellvibrionaceae bacterium]